MCYAVPGKIISISGENAVVDFDGLRKEANISLIESVKEGEFVLIHAGFAIEKISKEKANDSIAALKDVIEK